MNTTIEAMKNLYVSRGGSLTDKYEDIADGAEVGTYSVIPDCVDALSKIGGVTYEVVAEIQVGEMQKSDDLYMFSFANSETPAFVDGEACYLNDAENQGKAIVDSNGTFLLFNAEDPDRLTPTDPSKPVVAISFENGDGVIASDSDSLSNTTVRILKKVEQGGDIPANLKPTYEFGFDVSVGQTESDLIVTPDSGSTFAAISAALAETPNVYAVIALGFQNQVIRTPFSIEANGSGAEARQALALIWNGTKFMGARLSVAFDGSCDLIVRET